MIARAISTCSLCGEPGHNRVTCTAPPEETACAVPPPDCVPVRVSTVFAREVTSIARQLSEAKLRVDLLASRLTVALDSYDAALVAEGGAS